MLTFAVKKKRTPSIAPKHHAPTVSPMYHSLHLQQAKVRHILRSLTFQPKLTIGQPNDKYEQEADRVADEVMRMPEPGLQRRVEPEEEEETLQPKPLAEQITPLVQRQVEPEEEEEEEAIQTKLANGMQVQRQEEPEEEEEELQAKPLSEQITPLVQRQVEPEEEEEEELIQTKVLCAHKTPSVQRQEEEKEEEEPVMTKSHRAIASVVPAMARQLDSTKGRGSPLPANTRDFMNKAFGTDFSSVIVHTDREAARMSKALNAQAFTAGRDIYFGAGRYTPETSPGQKLLAHELTHVVQQGATGERQSSSVRQRPNVPAIQAYGRKLHYDYTWLWARGVFGRSDPRVPSVIARADQSLDEGWKHPTWTSIKAFIGPIPFPLVLLPLSMLIARRYGPDPLHFPSRKAAVAGVKSALKRATNPTVSFYTHAAYFGRQLHRYQDSFSHSFPPNAPYNRLSKARKGAPKALRPLLFAAQRLYRNTVYGRGAVIRHVILGYYPDDFKINSEQRSRDNQMETGTKDFLRMLLRSYRIWLRHWRTVRLLRIPGRFKPSIFGVRRVP